MDLPDRRLHRQRLPRLNVALAGLMLWIGLPRGIDRVAFAEDAPAEAMAGRLAAEIETRVLRSTKELTETRPETDVTEFAALATTSSWTEIWPEAGGRETRRPVQAKLWDGAIRAALAKSGAVFLPKQDKPYYIHDPILLKSGQHLRAGREAEIRLVPGAGTCMVRNAHLVGSQEGPIPGNLTPDTNILIEGGIWTTLATTPTQSNGNEVGRSDRQNGTPSCHGVMILNNFRGVAVRHVVIRQSRAHAIQVSNGSDFLVEDISFDAHRRDGVHVNGPASHGVIRGLRGDTGDDMVALNAWDWRNSAPAFGPIHHILVEQVEGNPRLGGTDEIRLLPGTKTFADGRKLNCPVTDCVFRGLRDMRTFKVYDQPNLELGRDQDFCDPIGTIRRVYFRDLVFTRPGRFQVAAHVDGLSIEGVRLGFDLEAPAHRDYRLVEIGPMSETYKIDAKNSASWVELFSPDRDVTVRGFHLADVRVEVAGAMTRLRNPERRLVRIADQRPNPDYPKTTPRGGRGKAIVIREGEP